MYPAPALDAPQLTRGTPPQTYGNEILTAVVQKMTDPKCTCTFILAGYEGAMKTDLLGANEGLERRFASVFVVSSGPRPPRRSRLTSTPRGADPAPHQLGAGPRLPEAAQGRVAVQRAATYNREAAGLQAGAHPLRGG